MTATDSGAPLSPLAEKYHGLGWQLVPTQWHRQRDGKWCQTPMSGTTGSAPFLTVDGLDQLVDIGYLQLHLEGGPECTGRFAKPAIRPPADVTLFDVDHGYSGKNGGDTLVALESQLGPLPGTWSVTARGPWQPSRRMAFRHPTGLVIKDSFFAGQGASIETVRLGHRYSWSPPAIHTRKGQVVGPIRWYDVNHNVVDIPHVHQLPELPVAWVQAVTESAAQRSNSGRDGLAIGESTSITPDHADNIVARMTAKLHDLAPEGGEFRNAVFGLAAILSRRAAARGEGPDDVRDQMDEAFDAHPDQLVVDENDAQWIEEGIEKGFAEPWEFGFPVRWLKPTLRQFMAGEDGTPVYDAPTVDIGSTEVQTAGVADGELKMFLDTYTRYTDPRRLGRRLAWMSADGPHRLPYHARHIVNDVIAGCYPAQKGLTALAAACRNAGISDPAAPPELICAALGAVLNQKVS